MKYSLSINGKETGHKDAIAACYMRNMHCKSLNPGRVVSRYLFLYLIIFMWCRLSVVPHDTAPTCTMAFGTSDSLYNENKLHVM